MVASFPIPSTAASPETDRLTLLIVDDESGPRESLRYIFKDRYNCVLATCGREGVAYARTHPVDAAILDIKMPDLSGIEVLRELKQIDPGIECIMLTGYETIETARAAIRHGAADYLNKPFDVFAIRDLMERCMVHRREKRAAEDHLQALRGMNEELSHELARTSRAVTAGVLAAGVVHEINSPLMIISGYTELLGESLAKLQVGDQTTSKEVEQHLSAIVKEIQRCKEITSRFLALSRAPTRTAEIIEVSRLLEDAVALIRAHRANRGVEITFACEGALKIRGHPAEVLQVLINLGVNALQAMDGKGHLAFAAQPIEHPPAECCCSNESPQLKGPMVKLSASDTGCGIAPENLKKIFQAYFTTKPQGSGIGLAIVCELIRNHGGALSVESKVGQGSTFNIYLPAVT